MRVSPDYPPNYRDINAALGVVGTLSPIFCYGDTIYNPLHEEVIGYGAQYQFAKKAGVSGKVLEWALDGMARSLSGELYGHIISHNEAKCKIRNYAKTPS